MMKMTKPIFEQHCSNKTNKGYLYIVKLSDESESFYKIGITSNEDISIRINQFRSSYRRVEIIHAFSHPCSNLIMDIERKLLSLEEKYTPNKMLPGYSECVKDIKKALEFIKSLDWIKDFENHESVDSKRTTTMFNDKQYNCAKLVKEYTEAVLKRSIAFPNSDEWYDAHEIAKAIEENPAYTDIVDYVKEYGFESALSYSEKSSTLSVAGVKRKLEKAKGKSIITEILKREITPGITLTSAQVNELLKNIYDKHGITDKPKPSHIKLAFNTVRSTIFENGKHTGVIRIKDKIN